MRSLRVIAACSILVLFAYRGQVRACWQSVVPSVTLRSTSLTGTITLNGKPISGALLSLHRFLGPYSIELGHADPRTLDRAKTLADGSFAFRDVPSGGNVIVMASPSNEYTEVTIVRPKSGENDKISINFFSDYCQTADAIDAAGKKVARSSRAIATFR